MKKSSIFNPLTFILFLLAIWVFPKPLLSQAQGSQASPYLGSDYKGNYVWGGAMNLAWNELNENILKGKLKLKTEDKIALEMVEKLNNPIFTKKDLDEKSYYIKSGFGQKTVNLINKESKEKFPTKSFAPLEIKLNSTDIIAYAYFLKEVEYQVAFGKKEALFRGQRVKGFYSNNWKQGVNVRIIKYENDDKFIVRLWLKDQEDELILAKGYNMTDPLEVLEEIKQNNRLFLPAMAAIDRFEAPILHLDHHRDYSELIGKPLANQTFIEEGYFIGQMFENIKFDMDEKGARVENEAVIGLPLSAPRDRPKSKNFILDKPYWVVMKRKDSQNPYFILGVRNTNLMEKL